MLAKLESILEALDKKREEPLKTSLINLKNKLKEKSLAKNEAKNSIENEIKSIVNELHETLCKLLDNCFDNEDSIVKNFYYEFLIFLTELRPRNLIEYDEVTKRKEIIDPISHAPIKEDNKFYARNQYIYDIQTLAHFINLKRKYIDPVTMKEFHNDDRDKILAKVKLNPTLIDSENLTFFIDSQESDEEAWSSPGYLDNTPARSSSPSLDGRTPNWAELLQAVHHWQMSGITGRTNAQLNEEEVPEEENLQDFTNSN